MKKLLEDFRGIEARINIPMFLKKYGINKTIIEIGVRYGFFVRQLLACDPDLIVGIDHWSQGLQAGENDIGVSQRRADGIYQTIFKQYMHYPNVKFFRGYSAGAVDLFDDLSVDFIYIDADHTEQGCWEDITRWWKKVRQGGILAGHDYCDKCSITNVPFGVIQAVANFMTKKEIDAKYLHTTTVGDYRSWMILKVEGE